MQNNLENYIKLNVIRVNQLPTGIVFTGKIKFEELNQIYKLTERTENNADPIEPNITVLEKKDDKQFQRQLSSDKLNQIETYLRNEISKIENDKSLGLFPSSVILYNREYQFEDLIISRDEIQFTENDEVVLTESIIENSYTRTLDCCFYISNGSQEDLYKLYVPKNKDSTLIVDGQHRFIGTQRLYNKLVEKIAIGSFIGSFEDSGEKQKYEEAKQRISNFEFIITYLVGFDIYEIGQIFATVNFKQKPVNRSLYFDIFGSQPLTDKEDNLINEIRFAHDLALHLNNNETSPVNSMIKLLGKGYGLFSQAFFVSNMQRIFRTGIWNTYLIDYVNGGKEYLSIAKFMKDYLQALKDSYPSAWAKRVEKKGELVYSAYEYQYILCKTTGLGAYFRLIKDIFPLVQNEPDKYKENIIKIFEQITDDEAEKLFSKTGDFGGTGGEGLQDKLFKHLFLRYNLGNLKKDNEKSVVSNNAEARTQ
jgi:DGQHR domain-containing protein